MEAECVQPTIGAVWFYPRMYHLKALMVLPSLMVSPLLQTPFQKSKAKDHKQCLEKKLTLRTTADIQSLLQEGQSIQMRLTMNVCRESESSPMTDF